MVQVRMYTFPYISLLSIHENIQHTPTNNNLTPLRCEDLPRQLMHAVQAGKRRGVNPSTLAFAIRLHCISRLFLSLCLSLTLPLTLSIAERPAIPALTEDEKHRGGKTALVVSELPYPTHLSSPTAIGKS